MKQAMTAALLPPDYVVATILQATLHEVAEDRIGIVTEGTVHGACSGANRSPDTRTRADATATCEGANAARRRTNRSTFRTVPDDLIV